LVIDYLSKRYRFKKISSITTKDLNKKEKKDGSIQVTPLKFKILETESDLFMSVRNYGNAYAYSTKNIVELLKNKNTIIIMESPCSYIINDVSILMPKSIIFGFLPPNKNFIKSNLKKRDSEDYIKQKIRIKTGEVEKDYLYYASKFVKIYKILQKKNDPTYAINQVEKILLEKGLIGINNIYEKRASIELTALKYAAANCQAEK